MPFICLTRLTRTLQTLLVSLSLLLVVFLLPSFGQEPIEEPDSSRQHQVIGRADTSSPRATLNSLIQACNEIYDAIRRDRYLDPDIPEHRALAMRIIDCLDASQLPEYSRDKRAGEAAICLKEILDRVEIPLEADIPDDADMDVLGNEKNKYRWRVPGTRITIARVEDGPQRHEYLFTPGTVERAADYYEDMRHLPYREHGPKVTPGLQRWYISAPHDPWTASIVDKLPDWVRNRKFGITIWKWPPLIISLLVAFLLMAGIYLLQRWFSARARQQALITYCFSILLPIAAMLVPYGLKIFVADHLALRGKPLYIVSFAADLVILLAFVVVVFSVCNRVAEILISSPRIHPRGLDAQLIRILMKLASITIATIIFLQGGQHLGIPVSTLLASAGVGGLAIALAAQDTLKALFGTITLMADKPFRVGDRIVIQNYDGVVEDIGLRSTQIRLLTGNQAIIPNDQLARVDIENVGRRPHIRRIAEVRIPLDTNLELVEKAVDDIRQSLENHEGMEPGFPPRVFFNEFNEDSFNIRVIYWYHPADYWKFLEFSQQVNLRIGQALKAQGISFLLPSKITYSPSEAPERRESD